jgi:hypothetical protein
MLPMLLSAAVLFAPNPSWLAGPTSSRPKSQTVTYTFQGYCDGIQLDQDGAAASGYHLESGCSAPDAYAGGFKGAITGYADTWDISTTESGEGDFMETYLIDEKSLEWFLYVSQDSTGTPFEYLQSGTLVKGYSSDDLRRSQAKPTWSRAAGTGRVFPATRSSLKPKAKTVTYTLSGYCDGVQLTQSGDYASGYLLESGCSLYDAYAGGFKAAIPGYAGTWDITTTLYAYGDLVATFLIDEKALVWYLYESSDTDGAPFQYVASGTLTTGYATQPPGAGPRLPSIASLGLR